MDLHLLLFLQAIPSQDKVGVDLSWLVAGFATIISSLTSALVYVYRRQITQLESEGTRKDRLIDELLDKLGRTTNVQEDTLDLVKEGRTRQGPRR